MATKYKKPKHMLGTAVSLFTQYASALSDYDKAQKAARAERRNEVSELGINMGNQREAYQNYLANHPELVYGIDKEIQALGDDGLDTLVGDIQLVTGGSHESGADVERKNDFVEGGEVVNGENGPVHSNRIDAYSPAQFSAAMATILDEISQIGNRATGTTKGELERIGDKIRGKIKDVTQKQEAIKGEYDYTMDQNGDIKSSLSSPTGNQLTEKPINALGNPEFTKLDKRIYNNVTPRGYSYVKNNKKQALSNIIKNKGRELDTLEREELWKYSLGGNVDFQYWKPSKYKPTKSKDKNVEYIAPNISISDDTLIDLFSRFKNKDTRLTSKITIPNLEALGSFTISKGEDENGKYMSIYDKWDLGDKRANKFLDRIPEIYDRYYYEETENGPKFMKPKKAFGEDPPFLRANEIEAPFYKEDNTNILDEFIKNPNVKTSISNEKNLDSFLSGDIIADSTTLNSQNEDKKLNLKGDGANILGYGLDLSASLIDNIVNANLLKKIPKTPTPAFYKSMPLETELDVTDQLSEISDQEDTLNAFIDASTISGNTAIQRKRANADRSIKLRNSVLGDKARTEVQLENQKQLNEQRITNLNKDQINKYNQQELERENNILTAKSQNVANLSRDVVDVMNKYRLGEFQEEQLLMDSLKYQDSGVVATSALSGLYDGLSAKGKQQILSVVKGAGRTADYDALVQRWSK